MTIVQALESSSGRPVRAPEYELDSRVGAAAGRVPDVAGMGCLIRVPHRRAGHAGRTDSARAGAAPTTGLPYRMFIKRWLCM